MYKNLLFMLISLFFKNIINYPLHTPFSKSFTNQAMTVLQESVQRIIHATEELLCELATLKERGRQQTEYMEGSQVAMENLR